MTVIVHYWLTAYSTIVDVSTGKINYEYEVFQKARKEFCWICYTTAVLQNVLHAFKCSQVQFLPVQYVFDEKTLFLFSKNKTQFLVISYSSNISSLFNPTSVVIIVSSSSFQLTDIGHISDSRCSRCLITRRQIRRERWSSNW